MGLTLRNTRSREVFWTILGWEVLQSVLPDDVEASQDGESREFREEEKQLKSEGHFKFFSAKEARQLGKRINRLLETCHQYPTFQDKLKLTGCSLAPSPIPGFNPYDDTHDALFSPEGIKRLLEFSEFCAEGPFNVMANDTIFIGDVNVPGARRN